MSTKITKNKCSNIRLNFSSLHLKYTPYFLILPSVLLFSTFIYYPFFKTILLSLSITDKKGNYAAWVGIKNFVQIVNRSDFWKVIGNTFSFAAMIGIGTFCTAMILALLCVNKHRGSRLFEVTYALPMSVASAPAAAIFIFMMRKDTGMVNVLLARLIGINEAWFQDGRYALPAVAAVTIWLSLGASFIFLLVGFRNVPEELLESARIDGAGALQRVFKILLPVASPQIFFVVFLNITHSFRRFEQIKLLTGGGPANATKTLIYSVYENAILNGRYDFGSVYALVLFISIFLITRIQTVLENKVVHYN